MGIYSTKGDARRPTHQNGDGGGLKGERDKRMKKTILLLVVATVMALSLSGLAQAMTACEAAEKTTDELLTIPKSWSPKKTNEARQKTISKYISQVPPESLPQYKSVVKTFVNWMERVERKEIPPRDTNIEIAVLLKELRRQCPGNYK